MSATFTITGSAAGAVKAFDDLNKALERTEKESDGAAKASKRLVDQAQRVRESIDPQAKYNRQIEDLARLVTKAGLSTEDAREKARRYEIALSKAGEAGDRAFGGVALTSIGGYIAGLGSVTAVVGAITKAFQDAEASAQSAASTIFDSLGAVGELGQLGTEGVKRALDIQRTLISNGTFKPTDRSGAANTAANMINANLSDDQIRLLTDDLGGAGGLVKAENLTKVGGNLKGLMDQFGETDMRKVTAQVLVAANKTKADLAATSSNMLTFGALAAASGIGLAESSAGYVASEATAKSAESAAEMQASFYSQVYSRQLGVNGSLEATLDNIKSKIPKGGTPFDVLGDKNAVIGYEDLQRNRDLLRANIADVNNPPAGMILGSRSIVANASPAMLAAKLKAEAEGQENVAITDATSERELLFDAMRGQLNARGLNNGEWALTRWLRNRDLDATDVAGYEADAMRGELMQGNLTGSRLSPELTSAIESYLKRIAEASEGTQKDQKSKVTTRPE